MLSPRKLGSAKMAFGSRIALSRRVVELKFSPRDVRACVGKRDPNGIAQRKQGSTRMALGLEDALSHGIRIGVGAWDCLDAELKRRD
jgi:hypothetical protein